MMIVYWSKERDEALRQLLGEGYSRQQVANFLSERFADRITRNAVCGRCMRLGIGGDRGRPSAKQREAATAKAKAFRPKPQAPKSLAVVAKPVEREAPKPVSAAPITSKEAWVALPESRSISLMDLGAGLCRWPLRDDQDTPDKTYCGADCRITARYCLRHTTLAKGQGTPSERIAHKAVLA